MIALLGRLPADELEALRRLSDGAVSRHISAAHGDKLVRRGLVRKRAGGLAITELGYARLAIEVTRVSWIGVPK